LNPRVPPPRASAHPDESPIAAPLLEWHAHAGRHDLPWQTDRTPYRVWVSEIMLQQTQVGTVKPYYERFMRRFPDVRALATASVDEVLHLWSGLGYYARARNLHRAAGVIAAEHAGELPRTFAALAGLPGIGRSTAGAILALGSGERFPILDGNVRRVLSRYFGVAGGRSSAAGVRRLWQLSERCTPARRVGEYTQAVMDLGALVCVRARPLCAGCPLASGCFARRTGRQQELPAARAAGARPTRTVYMVVALDADGAVLLERRPESGVWGGLWCLPEFMTATAAQAFIRQSLVSRGHEPQLLGAVEHAFTHFSLVIRPLLVRCARTAAVMEQGGSVWYNTRAPARIGLPAPISTLLAGLGAEARYGEPRCRE
jgi:A/G-specific adenine glycosylase